MHEGQGSRKLGTLLNKISPSLEPEEQRKKGSPSLPTNSETTGSESQEPEVSRRIGRRHGEIVSAKSSQMVPVKSHEEARRALDRARICLRGQLARQLASNEDQRYPNDAPSYTVEIGPFIPPQWGPQEARAGREALRELEGCLIPAEPDWIVGRAATLLSHYYTPDLPASIVEAALVDWASLLDGVPKWALERACMEWLSREPRKRPGPGDVKNLTDVILGRWPRLAEKIKTTLQAI
ncbi:MAG: hypothetical protein GY906_24205 [bacterium]|nr:hypothetical protein [bacterium]